MSESLKSITSGSCGCSVMSSTTSENCFLKLVILVDLVSGTGSGSGSG